MSFRYALVFLLLAAAVALAALLTPLLILQLLWLNAAVAFAALAVAYAGAGPGLLGKRPDGYHEIATLMVALALHDTLTFGAGDSLSLRCSDANLSTGPENLIRYPQIKKKSARVQTKAARLDGRRAPTNLMSPFADFYFRSGARQR